MEKHQGVVDSRQIHKLFGKVWRFYRTSLVLASVHPKQLQTIYFILKKWIWQMKQIYNISLDFLALRL